jgi:hypothetical protein
VISGRAITLMIVRALLVAAAPFVILMTMLPSTAADTAARAAAADRKRAPSRP